MATTVFLRSEGATTHRGTNTARLDGVASGWMPKNAVTTRGSTLSIVSTATVAGATSGVEVTEGANKLEWLTLPLAADVTISGVITGNIWSSEDNMNANVAINFVIDRVNAVDGSITQIVKSARITEVAVTTRAVNNFTATPGAGVACNRGDRLRIRIFGDDAGTMGALFNFDIGFSAAGAAADGDTFITFTETFSFETADPSGTTLYLTDDPVTNVTSTGSAKQLRTTRGTTVAFGTRTTGAGWITPVQWLLSDRSAIIEWYTEPLQAFTLGGLAKCNFRPADPGTVAGSLKAEIAVVNGDGSGASVWGFWNSTNTGLDGGQNPAAEANNIVYISGDDKAVTAGQRLRLRVFLDDLSYQAVNGGGGFDVDLYYNGPTSSASGDAFITLPQSILSVVTSIPANLINERRTPKRRLLQRL